MAAPRKRTRDSASLALLRIARAIATLDLREVVDRAARLAGEALRADRAVVYLVAAGHLEIVAGSGAFPRRGRWPLDTVGPYTKRVLATRKVIHVSHLRNPDKRTDLWFLSFVAAPIQSGEELLGCIQVGSIKRRRTFTRNEIRLVLGIADQIAVAVRNARLAEENARRLHELENLSRRLWTAQEDERRRISRELHDETGQALVALKMKLATLRTRENVGAVDEIGALASSVLENLRRIAHDLRPRSLDELGLAAVIRSLAASLKLATSIEVTVDLPPLTLDAVHENIAFRFVQEALTNVSRHARATRVEVRGAATRTRARLVVHDDGIGFDPAKVTFGLGLLGMRERAALAGGSLTIDSSPGRGTTITLSLPVSRAAAA